jgi:predicted ATPase
LTTGAVSYGSTTLYLPVIDLLKGYCQIEPADDAETMRERLTDRVRSLDRSLSPIVAPLLALLDLPVADPAWSALDPSRRRRATHDAVLRLLDRQSQDQPLLLAFEDLHWIDSETEALLDRLVESLPTARIVLLVNYRPEYAHSWGNRSFVAQIRVEPLAERSADELLHSLLGDDESLAHLKRQLREQTGGNPFFLEESVRGLVEVGALVGQRGAYTLALDVPSVAVPATVQAMLAVRIDRLEPEAKRLLRAVSGVSSSALEAMLSRLQAAELLYAVGVFPDPEYTFSHALTHDVAYGGLLQEQRRALHAAIVETIEGLYPERLTEHVERLAEHAYRSGIREKAAQYAWQAGRKTQALAAHREAAAHFERALIAQRAVVESAETEKELQAAVDLRLEMRTSLIPLGNLRRVHEVLLEAEELAGVLGDRLRLGHVNNYLANYYLRSGLPSRGVDHAQSALDAAEMVDQFALRVSARFHLALAQLDLGEVRASRDTLRANVDMLVGDLAYGQYGQAGLPAAMAWGVLVTTQAELGAFDAARRTVPRDGAAVLARPG